MNRFIHGGAWHDPEITSSFAGAAVAVLQDSTQKYNIRGFASINYRLSSHPNHAASPSHPEDPSRSTSIEFINRCPPCSIPHTKTSDLVSQWLRNPYLMIHGCVFYYPAPCSHADQVHLIRRCSSRSSLRRTKWHRLSPETLPIRKSVHSGGAFMWCNACISNNQ